MPADADPLVGCSPDPRLLDEHLERLPDAVGRPEPLPSGRARARLVAVGATLTGVTLLAGVALIVLGVIAAVVDGLGAAAIAAILIGAVLAGTHWGWVHVAEVSANALQERGSRDVVERRRRWLSEIEPFTRWEVRTASSEEGTITIETARYRPVPSGERRFTFARDVLDSETHPGERPAAEIAERAELARRRAAALTHAERERFEAARDAYERVLWDADDEQQRRAALRAASEALSEQINAKLRDPPLGE